MRAAQLETAEERKLFFSQSCRNHQSGVVEHENTPQYARLIPNKVGLAQESPHVSDTIGRTRIWHSWTPPLDDGLINVFCRFRPTLFLTSPLMSLTLIQRVIQLLRHAPLRLKRLLIGTPSPAKVASADVLASATPRRCLLGVTEGF